MRARRKVLADAAGGQSEADAVGVLDIPGQVAFVASTIEGFKRRSITLRWSLYDARAEQRMSRSSFSGVEAGRSTSSHPPIAR